MSWTENRIEYDTLAHSINPTVILVEKDKSVFFKTLWYLISIFTFGIYSKHTTLDAFLHNYATTIGPLQGYSSRLAAINTATLVHECEHTNQSEFLGWFVPIIGWFFGRTVRAWVGILPMFLLYVILPIPVGICYGRFLMEYLAEKKKLQWMKDQNIFSETYTRAVGMHFCSVLCGPTYFWPWPYKWAEKRFSKLLDDGTHEKV